MGLFRRKRETYNEQLLREAGLDRIRLDRPSVLQTVGVYEGRALGQADWDRSVTVKAPGLAGDRLEFATLEGGDVLIEDAEGDADVSALADAVEKELAPPYRARAARQSGDLWAVLAHRIDVHRIDFPRADMLELSRKDSWQELRVDGEPSMGRAPELERLGERVGADFFVKAERLDDDLWEVRVTAL
ncbi:MAG TPA: hypothetical protein VFN33_07895 [Gaiellaceae bacterium]|nr:hypothetical protein [Gaiellaceae bacterium]